MKTKYYLFALLAILIGGCKKSADTNQWTLGSSVYQANGYQNGIDRGFMAFLSLDYVAGDKQIPCLIGFKGSSNPPSNGTYLISDSSAASGMYVVVMDSADRTYMSHNSNVYASVQVVPPSKYNNLPTITRVSIPTVWVYNTSLPSDSIRFTANMHEQ